MSGFEKAIKTDLSTKILLISLKNLNLLYKRYSSNDLTFQFENFYHCLQSNISGIREETMQLIINYTKDFKIACKYMNIILIFIPWTNRIKFYFLTAILTNFQISCFYNTILDELNTNVIFEGLRFSLLHKSLFSPGQAVIKILDKQHKSIELKNIICKIIEDGTLEELINLNAQWMRYVNRKDEIYDELKFNENWEDFFERNYLKFPIICNMFTHQIGKTNNLSKIIECLIKNCFNYSTLEIQIHIYMFISDSIGVVIVNQFESCLNFILLFIQTYSEISNPEIRQLILCKIPQLFDLLSKKYAKMRNDNHIIVNKFFKEFMSIIHSGLNSIKYQPLIFSLRILEILNKSYFICNNQQQKRITKNMSIKLNQALGEVLIKEKIYNQEFLKNILLKILNCPDTRYDDVQEFIVNIFKEMNINNFDEAFYLCKLSNSNYLIDNCALSSCYTRICLNSYHLVDSQQQNKFIIDFFNYCKENIINIRNKIENDPLEACKNGNHLFGYMTSLNELLINNFSQVNAENINEIVDVVESIIKLLLKFFNEASVDDSENNAASFQTMDESLEILINRSCLETKDAKDDKKFLLLSFWMTLKVYYFIYTI